MEPIDHVNPQPRTARHRHRALLAALALTAVVVSARAASAGAQPRIAVSPSSVAPGETVTISGNLPQGPSEECSPTGDQVRLTSTADLFPPDGFGPEVPVDASGDFSATYTIPTTTPAGTYKIGMRCGGGNVGVNTTLRITPPTTTASTSAATTTAETSNSSSTAPWVLLGVLLLLIAAGTTAFLILRRRHQAPSPDGGDEGSDR
jgi:hypothetical protein